MTTIECDVLVVGAGPAGSCAAQYTSSKGLNTIFFDKKEEIGFPVQCAEGIGEYLIQYLPFKIPQEQLSWKMDGIYFWVDDISIEKIGDHWRGYSVDRRRFDKYLSDLAVKNGAELLKGTELIDFEFDSNENVKKALVKRKEKHIEISSKIIVAADGCDSTVLKLLDLYHPKSGDIADVYSMEMKNLDLYKPNLEQIFTGEFTPSGYAYIFPKSKNVANIGVGGLYPKKELEKYFEEFLEVPHVKKQVKNADFVIDKSKPAVWNDLTDKWIYGNVILTGDVANQNLKPFIEGILPSAICGDIAGKIAFDMHRDNNLNNKQYLNEVKKKFNNHFEFSKLLQDIIGSLFMKKGKEKYLQFFGIVTELLNLDEIKATENMNYEEIKTKLSRIINGL
jgi:digeranylgeranylglycerophospholipid reductase